MNAGLPEEVRITEAALAEGFAIVALSSQDRTHNRCWDTGWPPQHTADIPKVRSHICHTTVCTLTCIMHDEGPCMAQETNWV